MNLKKIMLIGIILFAILTIGAVSASQDLNSSDVFTSDELGEEVVQDDSSDVLGDVEVKDGENEIEDDPLIFDSTDEECYVDLYLQPDSKGTLTVSVDGVPAKLNVIGDSEEDEDDDFIITVNYGSKTQTIIYGEDYEDNANSAISNYASEDWSISFSKLAPGDHTIFIKFADSIKKNDPAYNLEKTFNITMIAAEEGELEIDIGPYYGKDEFNMIEFDSLYDYQISNLTVLIDGVFRNIVNRAIDLSALDLGKHSIVIYNGDKVVVNTTFTIIVGIITGPKEDSFIYNANKTISLTLPKSAEGNLIITINNEEIDLIPLVNGSATYSISNLGVGAYDIYADYDGGEFEVTPYEHYIEIYPIIVCPTKIKVGEKKYITFEANANTRGTFDVEVDWEPYASVPIVNGKASILLDRIKEGDVEITARYSSLDADVYSIEQNFEMEVASLNNSSVSIGPISDVNFGDVVFVSFVVVNKTDVSYEVRDAFGNVVRSGVVVSDNLTLADLAVGSYVITVTNAENENFTSSSASANFSVNDFVPSKSNSSVSIGPISDVNFGDVVFVSFVVVNKTDVSYEVRDAFGNVVRSGVVVSDNLTFADLAVGNYAIILTNVENENYTSSSAFAIFSVTKLDTNIFAFNVITSYKCDGYVFATLKDAKGNVIVGAQLQIAIDGKTHFLNTDAGGHVKLSTNSLSSKTYDAKITFDENDIYAKSDRTVTVTVKKANVKLNSAKITFKFKKSAKTKQIKVTLEDGKKNAVKGVKVTLKLSGKKVKGKKSYIMKTSSKGVVIFKISSKKTKFTKKGKYQATLTFKGNENYNKATKKIKISIK